jgi:hypothetical protein
MSTNQILATIFEVVIIPLLGVLTGFFIKWINAKAQNIKVSTNNELVKKYIDILDKIIESTVISVN